MSKLIVTFSVQFRTERGVSDKEKTKNGDKNSRKGRGNEKKVLGGEGISSIANAVKVGQRWERLIARPSG